MLELKISGESVDLLPGATITIEEESPVFERDSIPGGFSFPFNLPLDPRNRRVLGHPERLEKKGPMSIEQPFLLFADGLLMLSGTVSTMEAGDGYKANLVVGNGDLASKITDKKLADLDLGGLRAWEWKAEYKYPVDDFALAPVFNTEYYKDEALNSIFLSHHAKINAFIAGEFYHPDDNDDPWVITPFPFLSYLIRQIFKFAGFRIIENVIISDPDFRDLILYTIKNIAHQKKAYTVQEYSISHGARVPTIVTNDVIVTSASEVTTFNLADSMPDMTIIDFLLAVRNFLNLAYIVEDDRVRIIKRQDLICKPTAIDITNQATGIPIVTGIKTDGFKLEWPVDSDDALWGEDFYKNVEQFKAFIKDPLQSMADLADLEPDPNEIRYIIDDDLFVRYVYFAYDDGPPILYRWQWVGWSENYQNYVDGNAGEVFATAAAPMMTIVSSHSAPGDEGLKKGPWVEQKGAISDAGVVPPFALRLMFYRGLLPDSLDADYPYATNDNLDREGNPLTGKNLTLKFEGDSGIYARLYRKYLTWWMSRRYVRWTIKDPSKLSFAEKYAIDGKHYILKKRSINLSRNGVEPGECEFYLV